MQNNYYQEGYCVRQVMLAEYDNIIKDFLKPRFMREVMLGDLEFHSPYRVSLRNGHRASQLTKTGLETARHICGMPAAYLHLIEPDLVTYNLNERVRDIDPGRVKATGVVSRKNDFSVIDGFVNPKFKYVPVNGIIDLLRQNNPYSNVQVKITTTFGQTTVQSIIRDIKLEVLKDDIINPGFTFIIPWVIGRHQVSFSYERVICTNGMIRPEREFVHTFPVTAHPAKVLQNYRHIIDAPRKFEEELLPLRTMAKHHIDDVEIPAIQRMYKRTFRSIENFQGQTYYDLYNALTYESTRMPDIRKFELSTKAGELLSLFKGNDSDIVDNIWTYFKVA